MLRYFAILILLVTLGCQPLAIVYVPPVGIAHTPDLNGVVRVDSDAGQATAAVIAYRNGWYYAATAKHVTEAASWILIDGALAEKFAKSFRRDVSLIRWRSTRTYSIYPLARAELGQECWIAGYPYPGLVVNRGWVSRVSARAIWHNAGGAMGCSGGPVLSAKGELLGVVTSFLVEVDIGWIIPARNMYDSMGQAVSATEIARLMRLLPEP